MSYTERILPAAQAAAGRTGLPVSVVLAQWIHETGWGTSNLARNHENHAGIKYTGRPGSYLADPAGHAGYIAMDDFLDDYERVLHLSYYADVRRAAAAGRPVDEIIEALCASPYATDPQYGPKVLRILRENNLAQYDDKYTPPPPDPTPPASDPPTEHPGGVTVRPGAGLPVVEAAAGIGSAAIAGMLLLGLVSFLLGIAKRH